MVKPPWEKKLRLSFVYANHHLAARARTPINIKIRDFLRPQKKKYSEEVDLESACTRVGQEPPSRLSARFPIALTSFRANNRGGSRLESRISCAGSAAAAAASLCPNGTLLLQARGFDNRDVKAMVAVFAAYRASHL